MINKITGIIKRVFISDEVSNYVTEFAVTSHPTLSRPIVDSFINDTQKEIDYYNQHSLGRIYKAILQMKIFNTRRKFAINSWIGTDFDRGRYKFYDAIYAIEDARIRAGEIILTELREHSVDFEIYRSIAFLLNKLQDRSGVIKLIINELKAGKLTTEEFFEKIANIYAVNSIQKIIQDILDVLKNGNTRILTKFYNFIAEYGLDLSQTRHFRLDGTLLAQKSKIDINILKTIALAAKNNEKIAIIIANSVDIKQIEELCKQYGSASIPRIIPLIEDFKSVQYFVDNYSKIKDYLGAEKEIMLAGSDMTKSEGFFGAQYALYKFISQMKIRDSGIKVFLGSGTTIFRTGGQLQVSRLRHLVMTVFADHNLHSYSQTLQGGGVSFEGMADRTVVDLLRNYSKIRGKATDKLYFNNKDLEQISGMASVARREFFSKYENDFNSLISDNTELTNFGISVINDFGGSRDGSKTAFLDYVKKSRAIQFYTCFLNLGIPPIALEIPDDYDEFKKIIKRSVKAQDISTHYLLTVAAIQFAYSDFRYAKAIDVQTDTPIFTDMINKTLILEKILNENGYNILENRNLLNIVAEEWRIDNFQKLQSTQKIQEIQLRKDIIYKMLVLRTRIVKNSHLSGAIEMIKYINFAINDVKINGTNNQVEYLINYIENNLQNNIGFEDHFVPYSCYGLNKIIPYKN